MCLEEEEDEGERRTSSGGEMIPSLLCGSGGAGGYQGYGAGVMELLQGSGSRWNNGGGGSSSSAGEVVKATKSHSEAERRRRQRINAHLATLRTLLPNANKMDKASLLTEVVRQLKELRRSAEHAMSSEGGDASTEAVPGESDEIKLDQVASDQGSGLLKASICCEDRPGLLADLNQAIRSVHARAIRAEMSTIGGRTKSVVLLEGEVGMEERSTLQTALRAVLHKPGSGPYGFMDHKRLRLTRPVGRI